MKYQFEKTIIIALGGSVVYPESIDITFVSAFRAFIKKFLKKKKQFVIVVGGGRLSRLFQASAAEISPVTDEDKDWIGIHATRLNAQFLRTVLKDVADPVVLDARHKIKKLTHPVIIASGWRPGWSTDYIAAAIAHDFGVREFIVAGKPSHVYDKDIAKHRDAKPFTDIRWRDYQKLIPKKWTPGFHSPVDPVGARLAARRGITGIIVNGKDLQNLSHLITGKDFMGTVIHN